MAFRAIRASRRGPKTAAAVAAASLSASSENLPVPILRRIIASALAALTSVRVQLASFLKARSTQMAALRDFKEDSRLDTFESHLENRVNVNAAIAKLVLAHCGPVLFFCEKKKTVIGIVKVVKSFQDVRRCVTLAHWKLDCSRVSF